MMQFERRFTEIEKREGSRRGHFPRTDNGCFTRRMFANGWPYVERIEKNEAQPKNERISQCSCSQLCNRRKWMRKCLRNQQAMLTFVSTYSRFQKNLHTIASRFVSVYPHIKMLFDEDITKRVMFTHETPVSACACIVHQVDAQALSSGTQRLCPQVLTNIGPYKTYTTSIFWGCISPHKHTNGALPARIIRWHFSTHHKSEVCYQVSIPRFDSYFMVFQLKRHLHTKV